MVIGQYRILEKIGEGGMGVIYKAEHCTLEQTVAIKALPGALSVNSDLRDRFVREAKIQAKLSHPNVVNILNFFEFEGNHYIVMEYVEGETLEALIRSKGLIPPDSCICMFKQVLAGTAYAHSKGIVHRDLKPSNIIIKRDGTVKITDFGIAKISGEIQKTQTGIKVGTLWYMPPEQVRGEPAGPQSDIYALGVTLFEMIAGKVPFSGDSEYSIMKNIVECSPPSPRDFYPYVPVTLEKTILKALAKDPADRFSTIAEFEAALSKPEECAVEALAPAASGATLPRAMQPIAGPSATRRNTILGAGIALAAVALLSLFLTAGTEKQPSVEQEAPAVTTTAQPPPASKRAVVPGLGEGHERMLKTAQQSLDRHEYQKAAALFEKVLLEEKENKVARSGMEEATRGIEEQRKRETVNELLAAGQTAHGKGNYGKAIELYQKVLVLASGNKAALKGIDDARTARRAEEGLGLR